MRSYRVLLVFVLVAGLVGGVGADLPTIDESGTPPSDQLVRPAETGGYIWPYTSRGRSVTGRTLALNVVVRGDSDRVRRGLVDRSDANWSVTGRDTALVPSPWRPAHGAARYTYVTSTPNATGRWIVSDYQLEVGTYFGGRVHVRAYDAPSSNWTALQAHEEYWDWFRLRHTVTGVAAGGRFVERDVRDEPFVAHVSQSYHGLKGGGSNGWITLVDLASVVLIAGLTAPLTTRREEFVDLVLPAALVALVLGVRTASIAVGGSFASVNPKLFVALGYPLLAAGPPVLVRRVARGRPATRVTLLAVAGLGLGITLDFAIVGVSQIPIRLALHRLAVVAALGVFTLGIARDDRRTTRAGIGAWVCALVLPLAGIV